MMDSAELLPLIQDYGLALLAPLALVEGPLVSVLGGYLAGQGVLNLWALLALVIAADLAGDALVYALGRRGGRLLPRALRARLQRSAGLQERLRREILGKGTRLLVLGKLTHAAGFAVLLAAGAARFPFLRFMAVNLAATLVKSPALVALGWWLGEQWQRADLWLDRALVPVVALVLAGALLWLHRARARPA